MKIYSNFKKTSKILIFTIIFLLIATMSTACSKKEIEYLTLEQNNTLNSLRAIPGTESTAYEINYSADYKMDEFIKTITDNWDWITAWTDI